MMKKENDGASKKFENKTAGGKRRALKRAKKRKYGKGEAGKAKEAAEASIKFAEGNLDMMGASKKKPKGVKDADTEYMPVVDREKDAMKKGWSYVVTIAGNFFTEAVEVGDFLIAKQDAPTTLAHWVTVQNNV